MRYVCVGERKPQICIFIATALTNNDLLRFGDSYKCTTEFWEKLRTSRIDCNYRDPYRYFLLTLSLADSFGDLLKFQMLSRISQLVKSSMTKVSCCSQHLWKTWNLAYSAPDLELFSALRLGLSGIGPIWPEGDRLSPSQLYLRYGPLPGYSSAKHCSYQFYPSSIIIDIH